MNKKLIILLALLLSMALVAASCGGDTTETEDPGTTTADADETTEPAETDEPGDTEEPDETETPAEQGDYSDEPALILGATDFNAVFSPFFATTGYDMDIVDLVHANLVGFDRFAMPDDSGLTYYVTPEEILADDGSVEYTIYTFTLKENLVFSDGEPVTSDDVIFSMLVRLDPNYTGPSTLYTTPILGVNEYRYDDMDYADRVAAIQEEAAAYEPDEDEIQETAQAVADSFGMDVADFLPDGPWYEDYVLAEIRNSLRRELEAEYIAENLAGDTVNVPDVEGIEKVDELTVRVTIAGVDPAAIYNFGGIEVAPEHYYGEGFRKGDLSMVQAVSGEPMGAGAYRFSDFTNNIVTLVANDFYFKGSPMIKRIRYQVTSQANKLEGVRLGDFDISDPTASPEVVNDVEDDPDLHYELIDNLGYGYIGIDASRITNQTIRQGIMHLMDREPAVQSYYGNLASVIERPISRVSWAYPQNATEYYGFSPETALEKFEEAGYTQNDSGDLVNSAGEQLRIRIGIPADGAGDHPAFPIVLGVKNAGEEIGMIVDIEDYADGNQFFDDLDAGLLDLWAAAWGETPDPDMYQLYHTNGPSNYYNISDERLDELIMDARQTSDIDARKVMYAEALDIIMENAVEMPTYQRKNMFVFNTNIVDIETLPRDMTPYYGYFAEVETLQMVAQ